MSKLEGNTPGALILAAGSASRMGSPKALLPYAGGTLLSHVYGLASQIVRPESLWLVLGNYFTEMSAYCQARDYRWIFNPQHAEGMGTGIACGLRHLLDQNPNLSAIMILLADQPQISPAHLQCLLRMQIEKKVPVVCTGYGGIRGVPAVFSPSRFPELLALRGDQGARDLIGREIRTSDNTLILEDAIVDIDTPADYARLLGQPESEDNS